MPYEVTYKKERDFVDCWGRVEDNSHYVKEEFDTIEPAIELARLHKTIVVKVETEIVWSYEREKEELAEKRRKDRENQEALAQLIQEVGPEKALSILKRKGNPTVKVNIIESEAGWGQKVDETKEFDTREEAEEFCREYNAKNNEEKTPSWYMYAVIV
jgi:hypothetical protein